MRTFLCSKVHFYIINFVQANKNSEWCRKETSKKLRKSFDTSDLSFGVFILFWNYFVHEITKILIQKWAFICL